MTLRNGYHISILGHVLILIVFAVKVKLFSVNEIDLSQAIRVDMVGLPDKFQNPQLSNQEKEILKQQLPEKVEPELKKPDEVVIEKNPEAVKDKSVQRVQDKKVDADSIKLNQVKQKQKDALSKIKKMSAIEKIKQDLLNEQQTSKNPAKGAAIKGRVITKGTALTGLDRLQADGYLAQIDSRIKNQWALPQWLMGKPLKTKIVVKMSESGELLSRKVVQSSGNPNYDQYCLTAIDKAAPFPKVPEKFTEVFKEDGILIGFPE